MPQRECIFCRNAGTEHEHVIPKWMPRNLELEGELLSHDRALGIKRAKHVRIDDFKAKVICARCHDVITDEIETPAAGLLIGCVDGDRRNSPVSIAEIPHLRVGLA
jgi:hypothetical protein